MPKPSNKTQETLEQPVEQEVDIRDLDQEQQMEIVAVSVEAFCTAMEEKGIDSVMISAVLLDAFAARMADINDREGYEAMLEEAMLAEWSDITVH